MDFLIYKKFTEGDSAEALASILKNAGIAFEITEDRESLDPMLIGDKYSNRYYFVKLRREDFERADAVLAKESEKDLETVDKDYYLNQFTDEELFDILSRPDEWNFFDYQLSRKILYERGKEINDETIALLKKQRNRELAKPEEGQRSWIYAGYLFSLLGGLLGIFIGWHLGTFKKTLPNGTRVFGYSTADRRHGMRILVIGIVMFIIWIAVRIASVE